MTAKEMDLLLQKDHKCVCVCSIDKVEASLMMTLLLSFQLFFGICSRTYVATKMGYRS